MKEVVLGLEHEKEFEVTKKDTAKTLKSGSLNVLSTPMLVAFMENTAFESIQQFLEDDETSIGIMLSINHLGAAGIGAKIVVKSIIENINKNIISFKIVSFKNKKKIGEAVHKRTVINEKRFLDGLNKDMI